MGCEVWTTKETYICGCSFNTKSELNRKIKECEKTIEDCKNKLKNLIYMTEPKKFYNDKENIMAQIDEDIECILSDYEESQSMLSSLYKFEEAWDETHDEKGRCILPVNPLDLKNRKEYMGGDYMDYVLEDGSEMPDDWWDVYHGFVDPKKCSFKNKLGY